jgi:iron complex outermembrane receptor protein
MRKVLGLGVSFIALSALPGIAFAQAEVSTESDGASSGGLNIIVVTAQRREETAQNAAIPIDVVSGSDLVDAGITNSVDLGKLVPALTIQTIGAGATSFIRGIGNFTTFQSADSAVAFNYDGVYVARPLAAVGNYFDLERVEVLKGPQGTLYGRNATAGVINVIPKKPRLGETGGHVSVGYGNYNDFNAEGAVNLAIGEKGAFRLSGTVSDRDGYLSDGTADNKSYALRAQVMAEVTPNLTVRLAGDYTHLGGKGTGLTPIEIQSTNVFSGVVTVTPTGIPLTEGPTSAATQAFWTSLTTGGLQTPFALPGPIAGRKRDPFPELFRNTDFYGITAEISWDIGDGNLTIIPSARWDVQENRSATAGFPLYNFQKDEQYSLEARYTGSSGPIDYTLGGFYFNEDINVRSGTYVFGTTVNFQEPQDVSTDSWAAFASVVANLTDQLRLVGGVRYTKDSKNIDATVRSVTVGCTTGFTCPDAILPTAVFNVAQLPFNVPPPGTTIAGPTPNSTITADPLFILQDSQDTDKVTWRAALEYDVAPDSLLYASVETGFRSGGFNISLGFETYEPETITAYTIGSKNLFFDRRLQVNVEAFWWEYKNQQIAHPGVDRAFRPGSITENIGSSRTRGVEVDTRFLATDTTILRAQVAYLETKNKEFTYQVPFPLRPLTNCGITVAADPIFRNIDCSGLPAFNAPKWTVNLGIDQTIPVGDFEIGLHADTQFKSSRYLGFEYQPQMIQSSSWTSNANISFGPSDGQWSISAYVRNIENDRLLTAPVLFGGILSAYSSAPRTYGVRASLDF